MLLLSRCADYLLLPLTVYGLTGSVVCERDKIEIVGQSQDSLSGTLSGVCAIAVLGAAAGFNLNRRGQHHHTTTPPPHQYLCFYARFTRKHAVFSLLHIAHPYRLIIVTRAQTTSSVSHLLRHIVDSSVLSLRLRSTAQPAMPDLVLGEIRGHVTLFVSTNLPQLNSVSLRTPF